MSESESLWSNMNAFNWSKSAQLLFDSMSETRSKRECGKEKSLGAPGPLPGSCLATYRDVFLATEYLPGGEEASAEGVKEELKHLFSKVTPTLRVIEDKSVVQKILRCCESVKRFRNNKLTAYQKAKFFEHLDRIFNISKFQHKLRSCVESFCTTENCRIKDLHLDCPCLPLDKVPKDERAFMKDQMLRCKFGDKGKYQMSNVNRRQAKRDERALEMRIDIEPQVEDVVDDNSVVMEDINQNESKSDESESDISAEYEDDAVARLERVRKQNWIPLTNLAREADRYGLGNRPTADIATAVLLDYGVIQAGDLTLAIDPNKVQRARQASRKRSKEMFSEEWEEQPVTGLYFDGRKDMTLCYETDKEGKRFPRVKKENHLTLVSEPKSEFISSLAETQIADNDLKGAELEAKLILDFMSENGMGEHLEILGCDSTRVNSGRTNGVMKRIENFLDRNLMRVLCALHTNELPLRHLFEAVDGKTSGKDSWTGPIGKLLTKVLDLPLDPDFTVIDGVDLPELSDEEIQDLSTDQKYLYRILQIIKTGTIPPNFEKFNIGPLNHARWLTLANRICRLFISKVRLSPKLKSDLFQVVQFIMLCYGPGWFHIKTKPNLIHSPEHVLISVTNYRKLPESTQKIVKPFIASNAYHANSEHILLAMLCSDDSCLRENAVKIILDLRAGSHGGSQLREFVPPKTLNFDATSITELIDWNQETITEPPLTFKLSLQDLIEVEEKKLTIKPYKVHTQSVERAVKLVTQASISVYGPEARDGFVKATVLSRRIMPKLTSKKDFAVMINK